MRICDTLQFAVIGGDTRQLRLAELLRADGHRVHTFALERGDEGCDETAAACARNADCVILPMPLSREQGMLNAPLCNTSYTVESIFAAIEPGTLVCVGGVRADTPPSPGLHIVDYLAREDLAIANSVPTAEGAIMIAMQETPYTIHGTRALVIGNGRCGRSLARRLAALGAHVAVSSRKASDQAWVMSEGYEALETGEMEHLLGTFRLVFNTVPAPVLGAAQLRHVNTDALVIDLASLPGGVDMEAAAERGVRVIRALSLPGKVAPETAAGIVRDTVYRIIEEAQL